MTRSRHISHGFTLIELLVAIALAGIVLAAMSSLITSALGTDKVVAERNQLQRDARFALERILSATSHSRRLLLPLPDNPNTNWPENIREQTIPASASIGDSTFASAVLAVTLPAYVDLDADGYPDADDDRDGRIDEDLPDDIHNDFLPGIMLIDDDGDGLIDENPSLWWDDDEDGIANEDPFGNIDNDGDGAYSEDPSSDTNADGCPGLCGVDDNSDGTIDGGTADNDDEQGTGSEDGYDPVVFYLDGTSLMERMPVPWDTDGISGPDGPVDGRDWIASSIADNVSRFRVERVATAGAKQLVKLELELAGPSGGVVSVSTSVLVGGAL